MPVDDTAACRGRVAGMDPTGTNTVIKAEAPLAEIWRYAPDLKSMTGGRCSFTMMLSGSEEVPPDLIRGIVAKPPCKKDSDED